MHPPFLDTRNWTNQHQQQTLQLGCWFSASWSCCSTCDLAARACKPWCRAPRLILAKGYPLFRQLDISTRTFRWWSSSCLFDDFTFQTMKHKLLSNHPCRWFCRHCFDRYTKPTSLKKHISPKELMQAWYVCGWCKRIVTLSILCVPYVYSHPFNIVSILYITIVTYSDIYIYNYSDI